MHSLVDILKFTYIVGYTSCGPTYIESFFTIFGQCINVLNYKDYYPSLNNMKKRFGDSDDRRFWRSKQNVYNPSVMCYCKDLSQYYIHLEDNVTSSPSFFP